MISRILSKVSQRLPGFDVETIFSHMDFSFNGSPVFQEVPVSSRIEDGNFRRIVSSNDFRSYDVFTFRGAVSGFLRNEVSAPQLGSLFFNLSLRHGKEWILAAIDDSFERHKNSRVVYAIEEGLFHMCDLVKKQLDEAASAYRKMSSSDPDISMINPVTGEDCRDRFLQSILGTLSHPAVQDIPSLSRFRERGLERCTPSL